MSLVQWNHVVQCLAPYAAHPSFRDSVCTRTPNAHADGLDPPAFKNVRTSVLNLRARSKMTSRYGHGRGHRFSELLHNPLA